MTTSTPSTPLMRLPKNMQGVTMIELMISLTIGLIIIAGIGYIFLSCRQSFRNQDALSRMQEGARAAFEIMDKDIRMAGFKGCPANSAASGDINNLVSATDWDKNLIDRPLIGYETIPRTLDGVFGYVLRGDALTVLHADNSQEYFVSNTSSDTPLTLTANHNIALGAILVVTKADCTRNVIFQNTKNCTLSNVPCLIEHTANTCASGNIRTGLGTPIGSCPLGTSDTFPGGRIYRLSAATYYIGTNSYGEPALYRQTSSSSSSTAEELIEGVQDMQLLYGIDTNADFAIDSYVTADKLTTSANWLTVLGIRVSLLMVSRLDEQGITTQPQRYSLDKNGDGDVSDTGETVTPTDTLLRKMFTTTIAVKNRL